MKKVLFLLTSIIFSLFATAQTANELKNLKAFAEVFGYVKYYHPSDEAYNIDWDALAIYGSEKVIECKTDEEFIQIMNRLFKPIAPSILISDSEEVFDFSTTTPADINNYKRAYWQHMGVSYGMVSRGRSTYQSVRVNARNKQDNTSSIGNLISSIDLSKYHGKKLKYTGWAKLNKNDKGTGHLWFRVDNKDGSMGFFDNMGSRPIKNEAWQKHEITATIDSLGNRLVFGAFLNGHGTLSLDDFQLAYQDGGQWIKVPIKNGGFENDEITGSNSQWKINGQGFDFKAHSENAYEGKKYVSITYVGDIKFKKGESIFDAAPDAKALVKKEISKNIFFQMPLTLYANKEGTYPTSDNKTLENFRKILDNLNLDDKALSFRLGNIINTYNVFQHFYPYFNEVKVDWTKELKNALERSYSDKSLNDHVITLQKLTAKLKDGHIRVSGGNLGDFAPLFSWEWVENKLVVTGVDEELNLKVGDIITKINGQSSKDFFEEINSRVSAGTSGWLNYRAETEGLRGDENSKISVEVNGKEINFNRTMNLVQHSQKFGDKRVQFKKINDEVSYLNLDLIKMDSITKLMPKLKESKSIICDLRGYPNGNHDLISHLLKTNDTTKVWMKIPQTIYPNQEKKVGYNDLNWEMTTKKPYLGDKQIIFLIDGSAISYAESYMGYIKGYKLATIIGQPTAGANGNVNAFALPGNIRISFTGMKVIKHNGEQLHAVGIIPDILMSKTIKGIREGRDEILEKAIELTNN